MSAARRPPAGRRAAAPRGRAPQRRRRRRARSGPARRLLYALLTAGIGLGAAALAPIVDDLRSDLRAMAPGCRAVRVVDGDTLDLACGAGDPLRVRVVGYDAPELFSPACPAEARAAAAARDALGRLVATDRLEVAMFGADKYGRRLADLRADGVRVAAAMVAAGHGRRYLGGLRGGWCA